MKIKIAAILCLCFAFFVIGRWTCEHKWSEAPAINAAKPYEVWLPSPVELQTIIGVKADGIVGPETMRAWEDYYCNYWGVKNYLQKER